VKVNVTLTEAVHIINMLVTAERNGEGAGKLSSLTNKEFAALEKLLANSWGDAHGQQQFIYGDRKRSLG